MSGLKSSKAISIRSKNYSFLKFSSTLPMDSPAFSPSQISGLALWLDASTISLVDGATVSTWRDQGSSANDLTTAVGSPIFKTSIRNGKPVVRFTGSQRMSKATAVLSSKSSLSIFFVFCPTSTVINIPFEQGVSDFSMESTGSLNSVFYVNNTGAATGPSASVQNQFEYKSVLANGNTITHYRNGIAGIAANYSGNTGTAAFNLGSRSNNSFATSMDMAELIIYDNNIGNTNRQLIERYLISKYAF